MPKNKTQGIIFGLIMSYSMAIGMEIYNNAMQQGVHLQPGGFTNLTYAVVGKALVEAAFMGALVMVISSLWGNRLGARLAARVCDPARDNPFFCRLMRQAGTVMVMCPSMCLAATIIFTVIMGGAPLTQLPVKWFGTLLKNLPMAFFLEYVCGGAVHQLGVREAVPMKKAACPADRLLFYAQARGEGTNRRFRSAWVGMPSSTALSLYCHMSKA